MTCSSYCMGLWLLLAGPEAAPADPEPDLVDTLIENEELSTLPEQLYTRATEHAEKGQYHDAAELIARAYSVMPDEDRHRDPGLDLLIDAVDFHLKAHRQTGDDALLGNIQLPVEDFIEHYEGKNPRLSELEQSLGSIREMRLAAFERYFEAQKFAKAAIEAHSCYDALQDVDKGRSIGERTALAASRAHRRVWYLDGDIHSLEAASVVLEDHWARVGENAPLDVKSERRLLARDLAVARSLDRGGEKDGDPTRMSPRDRSFLIASGAALGGGLVLSAAAAGIGAFAFEHADGPPRIEGQPGLIAGAIPLGVLSGVVTGLAIHSMADTGVIPPRGRKILGGTATAVGVLGVILGSTLLVMGETQERVGFMNAGFSVMVGMGAPLGAGIAALISRRAGAR